MQNLSVGVFVGSILFLIAYWITSTKLNINNWLLFIFGIFLYSWGNIFRGTVLIFLVVLNYLLINKFFDNQRSKNVGLAIGIFVNVAMWLILRYLKNDVSTSGVDGVLVGTSFYILRTISYLISAYHDVSFTQNSFLEYGLYVSFFPQILSGPIEKPAKFITQLKKPRNSKHVEYYGSTTLILFGLVKKIVIADNLRILVDRIFQLSFPHALLVYAGSIAFYMQLFCDLSGYTDISCGIAGLLGFRTQKNFDNPFFSISPQDFWNRWHISFTQWLTTTIFFPIRRFFLSKNHIMPWIAVVIPVMLTMIISGFWHGVGPQYILWGGFHGILLLTFYFLQIDKKLQNGSRVMQIGSWFVTFQCVLFGWVLFKTSDMQWLRNVITSLSYPIHSEELIVTLSIASQIFMFSLPLLLHFLINRNQRIAKMGGPLFYAAVAVILIIFSSSGFQEFIYFGF